MFGFFKSKKLIDETFLEHLEEDLINADVGMTTFSFIMNKLRKNNLNQNVSYEELKNIVATYIKEDIGVFFEKDHIFINKKPFIIQIIGSNGAGKTTSIAKLTHMLVALEYKVLLVPCDTFRAGAAEQLRSWADKLRVDFFNEPDVKDPCALAYKACVFASQSNYDVVIIDTAGRQDNNADLMNELKKMDNVLKKCSPTAPHECLLVIDANMGQSGVTQAINFNKVASISGIIATKMEALAKAGTLISIMKKVLAPIYFIGIGESETDYKKFDIDEYLYVLLHQDNAYIKTPLTTNYMSKAQDQKLSTHYQNPDSSKISINNQSQSFKDFLDEVSKNVELAPAKNIDPNDMDKFLKEFDMMQAHKIMESRYNSNDIKDIKNKVNLDEINKIISKYEK